MRFKRKAKKNPPYPAFVFLGLLAVLSLYQNFTWIPYHNTEISIPMGDAHEVPRQSAVSIVPEETQIHAPNTRHLR